MTTDGKWYKWKALALLWVAFFLQQGTRQIFGATLSSIQGSFGVAAAEAGLVMTVFMFVYGLSVPFAGLTADLLNRKWMVVSGVFVFCLGIFASGFASSIGLLLATYGILNGFGQSFYYPSATAIVGELHKDTRATALSILQMGLYCGIVGCSAVAGRLAEGGTDGWRMPFWVFGSIGIAWAVVLALGLKRGGAPHVAQSSGAEAKPTLKEAVRAFAANPSALLLTVGLGMMIYVDVGFKTWMPSHVEKAFGLTKGDAALNAVLWHYLGAFVGVTVGGRFSDRFVKRRPSIRMETKIVGLVLSVPFIVWMGYAPTIVSCCAAMALFGVFRGVYDSNLMASLFDIIPPRYHASATGLMLSGAFVFGSTASVVLGWMKDFFSSSVALASLAVFYIVGAVAVAFARRRTFFSSPRHRNF